MVSRFSALFLLLVSAAAFSQTPGQPASNVPKSFHDPLLNITYFYPGRFTPVAPEPPKNPAPASTTQAASSPQCAQSTLSASSTAPAGAAVFVLSTIDNTCPSILHGASTDLAAFTREQILRQLKRYGDPVITQEPSRYVVDGHPAVVAQASAQHEVQSGTANITPPTVTYAAKACWLGNVPAKSRKRSDPADEPKHILCFDFTTQHRDLLSLLFAYSIQFDDHSPQPLIPGNALR